LISGYFYYLQKIQGTRSHLAADNWSVCAAAAGIWVTVGGYYLNKFFLETCCIQPALVGLIQLGAAWRDIGRAVKPRIRKTSNTFNYFL